MEFGSARRARGCPAVLLMELENEVRANIVALDVEIIRYGVWQPGAAAEFLDRHLGTIELVMGRVVMCLLAGRELLEVMRQVEPAVPMLPASPCRLRSVRMPWPDVPGDLSRFVPFDAATVIAYIDQLQRLPD